MSVIHVPLLTETRTCVLYMLHCRTRLARSQKFHKKFTKFHKILYKPALCARIWDDPMNIHVKRTTKAIKLSSSFATFSSGGLTKEKYRRSGWRPKHYIFLFTVILYSLAWPQNTHKVLILSGFCSDKPVLEPKNPYRFFFSK